MAITSACRVTRSPRYQIGEAAWAAPAPGPMPWGPVGSVGGGPKALTPR